MNREQWLNELANQALPVIARTLDSYAQFREEESAVRLSCGFPAQQGKRNKVAACIVPPTASDDFSGEIFVSPTISQGNEVALAVLPLLCATVTGDYRKGAAYREALKRNRLNAASLPAWAAAIVSTLPAYPHAAITLQPQDKQTTRLLKVACLGDLMNGEQHAAYIVRISRTTLANYGSPICPLCGAALAEGI